MTLKIIIPFAALAIIAVLARFVARNIQKLQYELDDYLSVVGVVRNPLFLLAIMRHRYADMNLTPKQILTLGCFTLSCKS